jgi:outer membrane receptor for ferrienterochelin and colicin
MFNKYLLVFCICFSLLPNIQAAPEMSAELTNLLSMDLESLSKVQIYSANRKITNIEQTSAIITVITAEDIARRGYRSIHEVIQQVPGHYFNVSSGFENLTSRGISQTLTSFLLLIDGHAVNNVSAFGISVETVFPNLSDVERIEVIRGAGSVMWGGEAGLGVIHVITKTGNSLDETGEGHLEFFVDYEADHKRRLSSVIYGKRFEQGDLMASLKAFDSAAPFGQVFTASATGPQADSSRFNANWNFDLSYEFTFKGHFNDFGFKGQLTEFNNHSFDNSQFTKVEYGRVWIEFTWSPQFTEHTHMESRFYFNDFETIYKHPRDQFDDVYTMQGGGAEAIVYYETEDFSHTVGVLSEAHKLEIESGLGTNDGISIPLAPSTTDVQVALFGEGTYKGVEDWLFTLGVRVQYNKGILDETQFLPRLAVIHSINDNWVAKYVYNHTEVKPTMELWRNGNQGHLIANSNPTVTAGAQDQQQYDINDLQLNYSDEQTSVTASLFYIKTKDMIQFLGARFDASNGIVGIQRWVNGPDVRSQGVQLEFTHQLENVNFYGDYTYADAEFDERFIRFQGDDTVDLVVNRSLADESLNLINTPSQIWNLGADIEIRNSVFLNLHYRGYTDLKTKFVRTSSPVFKEFGPEHFFDASILWRDAGLDDLEITLYVRNIIDNDAVIPDTVSGGFVENVLERQTGLSLKYSF